MPDQPINNKTQREMIVSLTISAAVQETKLDTVIETLKAHCEADMKWREVHNREISIMKSEIAVLKVKAAAWGMAGGAIPLIVMIATDWIRGA